MVLPWVVPLPHNQPEKNMRYPNSPKATGSMIGKHDLQHQSEMNEILKQNGLTTYSSFERLRGRVCLVGPSSEREIAAKLFLSKYSDFIFHKDEFPQGDTHFQYFSQTY